LLVHLAIVNLRPKRHDNDGDTRVNRADVRSRADAQADERGTDGGGDQRAQQPSDGDAHRAA